MYSDDDTILRNMIGYCDDLLFLMRSFQNSFYAACRDKTFPLACDIRIRQICSMASEVSEELAAQNRRISWQKIQGLRQLYVRGDHYDQEALWKVLCMEIPKLYQSLSRLQKKREKAES